MTFARFVEFAAVNDVFIEATPLGTVSLLHEQKKPTWPITLRCSATSAYSLTSPPARPGCPSSSRPTTSKNQIVLEPVTDSIYRTITLFIIPAMAGIASQISCVFA